MTYATSFDVVGTRPFPIDMLRYDCCFPVTSVSSAKLDETREHLGLGTPEPPLTVKLRTIHKDKRPHLTPARWRSFGWTLVSASVNTVRL